MVDLCLQAVLDEGVCILGEMSRNIRTSFVLYWKHIEPCLLESGCWARLTAAGKGKTSTFSLQLRKQHDALKCRSGRFPPRASKGSRDGNGAAPPTTMLETVAWCYLTIFDLYYEYSIANWFHPNKAPHSLFLHISPMELSIFTKILKQCKCM
jgi:hypothetical protein